MPNGSPKETTLENVYLDSPFHRYRQEKQEQENKNKRVEKGRLETLIQIKATPKPKKNKQKKSSKRKRRRKNRCNHQVFYAPLSRPRTSVSVGSAGIAPFLVVVMAPHAFANLSTCLSLGSS